jgi:hypothetical protein
MSTGIFSFECFNLPWLFGFVVSFRQHPLSSTLNIVRPFGSLCGAVLLVSLPNDNHKRYLPNAIEMPNVKQHSTPIKTCQLIPFAPSWERSRNGVTCQTNESALRWSYNILWVSMKSPPMLSQKIECHNLAMVGKNYAHHKHLNFASVSFTQTAHFGLFNKPCRSLLTNALWSNLLNDESCQNSAAFVR